MLHIIGGLIIMAIGTLMVLKTEPFQSFTGRIAWAEEHAGGTRNFLKLMGVAVALGGILIMTNLLGALFLATFGKLLFLNRPPL